MNRQMISILFAMCLSLNCFSVVRADVCEKEENEKSSLPPNLILSRQMKSLVEKVWRRSPTFRLQCQRISQAQWLKVKLNFALKPPAMGKYRALTVLNKRSHLATVVIYTPQDFIELIGHEFEHVLEQIEGLNLDTLVAEKSGQAYRQADGSYETARALDAGRKVDAEYRTKTTSIFKEEMEKYNDSQNTFIHHHRLAGHAGNAGKRSGQRGEQ